MSFEHKQSSNQFLFLSHVLLAPGLLSEKPLDYDPSITSTDATRCLLLTTKVGKSSLQPLFEGYGGIASWPNEAN